MAADKARVLDQLRSQKAFFKYDYGNATLDPWLTEQLASLLASTGINDIRDIAFYKGVIPYVGEESIEYMPAEYFYDAETGNTIQGIGGRDFDPRLPSDIIASTKNNDFQFFFHAKYANGVPYFVVEVKPILKGGGSWLKQFAEGIAPILPVIMIAANIFAPGFAGVLGNAILGPLGITSPALFTAMGNIAISTVASGGDIESAVKSAMLGSLGAQIGSVVGQNVGGVFDSDLLAKATSAATSAAITGGDPKLAVLGTLVPAGVQTMGELYDSFGTVSAPDDSANFSPVSLSDSFDFSDPSSLPDFNGGGVPSIGDTSYPFATGDYIYTMTGDPVGANPQGTYDVDMSAPEIPVYTATPDVVISGNGQTSSATDWVSSLSNLALAAIKINAAYQSAGKPQIQVSGQTVQGRTVVASQNGTVSVGGRTQLPPKGVPYITSTGGMIVNNGDGTYTSISNSGISATNPYPQNLLSNGLGSILAGNSTPLLIGAALLGVLLIARR